MPPPTLYFPYNSRHATDKIYTMKTVTCHFMTDTFDLYESHKEIKKARSNTGAGF